MTKYIKFTLLRIFIAVTLFLVAEFSEFPSNIKICIYLAAYVTVAYDTMIYAVKGLMAKSILDENFLMSIATVGAILLSYYEEAVGVMVFALVGGIFEDFGSVKAQKSIADTLNIRPDTARIKTPDGENIVSPEDVKVGDIVIVKPGEKIPIDGRIVEGSTTLNTSALTGESLPKDVECGDNIYSGCINIDGMICIKAERSFSDSTVSNILKLVKEAEGKKSSTEKFITKFSIYYTPIVVGLAVLLATLPPLLANLSWHVWIYRALLFLVVSCPCALILSVPLAFFGAMGGASKMGVILKGSAFLEAIDGIKTMVFDKTGTLTEGKFVVDEVHPKDCSKEELLTMAAYAEYYSNHPLAKAITSSFIDKTRNEGILTDSVIDESVISNFHEISGKGSTCIINGNLVAAGNEKLMNLVNINNTEKSEDNCIVHIAVGREYKGYISLKDAPKVEALDLAPQLKKKGVRQLIVLTGDSSENTLILAQTLGFDGYFAELMPADKVNKVDELKQTLAAKEKICFVGEGINDAPVISGADVGIAMGVLGSDAAIEAADIVIMDDNLAKLPKLFALSKKARSVAKQNIFFALSTKAAVLILGAAGLAGMWMAIFADVGVSVLAILNSLRCLSSKHLDN